MTDASPSLTAAEIEADRGLRRALTTGQLAMTSSRAEKAMTHCTGATAMTSLMAAMDPISWTAGRATITSEGPGATLS